ncbi:hypothetical protein CD133_05265 [Staphylococcus massiliensis CCUG 55927]|uniref:Uncharacterized protein n=1 Tax=Staphylococcus massiliensis S46 TaxID=1229783 RepID=K9AY04_9STAP|nr:hypothetical protein C273_07607 [Staphylococcus massiliensis S46]POA00032.1 hypothetical protein CD133_05265 [Staphylococcus massiliensis CCUG 55927]
MSNNRDKNSSFNYVIPVCMLIGTILGILIGILLFPIEYIVFPIAIFSAIGYLISLFIMVFSRR